MSETTTIPSPEQMDQSPWARREAAAAELADAQKAVGVEEAKTQLASNRWESRMATHMAGKEVLNKLADNPDHDLSDEEISKMNRMEDEAAQGEKHGFDPITEDDEKYFLASKAEDKAEEVEAEDEGPKPADAPEDEPKEPKGPTGPAKDSEASKEVKAEVDQDEKSDPKKLVIDEEPEDKLGEPKDVVIDVELPAVKEADLKEVETPELNTRLKEAIDRASKADKANLSDARDSEIEDIDNIFDELVERGEIAKDDVAEARSLIAKKVGLIAPVSETSAPKEEIVVSDAEQAVKERRVGLGRRIGNWFKKLRTDRAQSSYEENDKEFTPTATGPVEVATTSRSETSGSALYDQDVEEKASVATSEDKAEPQQSVEDSTGEDSEAEQSAEELETTEPTSDDSIEQKQPESMDEIFADADKKLLELKARKEKDINEAMARLGISEKSADEDVFEAMGKIMQTNLKVVADFAKGVDMSTREGYLASTRKRWLASINDFQGDTAQKEALLAQLDEAIAPKADEDK